MRLFVAIELTQEVRKNVASLLNEFRVLSPHTKWIRPDSMHLTLKFLGETDSSRLSEIKAALAFIHSPSRITLKFQCLGFFPNSNRPHVFWVGIEPSSNLRAIVGELDQSLHRLGVPTEDREFRPHITLARLNSSSLSPALRLAVSKNMTATFGSFATDQFHLIESKLKSTGAEYTTLQSFSFVSEARR